MTKQPKVTLINVTKDAAEMLMLAKSTRLEMTPSLLMNIYEMEEDEKNKQLEYIANTIPSSWEFVDFIFLIQNVTRAFTHQFVRSRHASYAQQTMRVLNVDGWTYATGPTIEANNDMHNLYDREMDDIALAYNRMIENGIAIEDARGILPTNIHTNILVKMNLRALAELVHKRSSSRVQGEYREVLKQLKETAIDQLPWVRLFVERTFDKAADELDYLIQGLDKEYSTASAEVRKTMRMQMIKLLDQMRMKS